MDTNKKKQEELIHKDGIRDQVADLFDGRVGECYKSEELTAIFTQGEKRYAASIPPGYKDGGKIPDPKTESDKRSNFGDWIIWKQVMDHAASAKTPIIFVTDDRKEDWWEEEYGKTLGPRPELTKEFMETSSQKILIYKPDSFLNLSQTQLKIKISTKSIDEVEAEHSLREAKLQKTQIKLGAHRRKKINRLQEVMNMERNRKIKRAIYSESDVATHSESEARLVSELRDAISHRNMLKRRAVTLGMEDEPEDEEMLHQRYLDQGSLNEELSAVLSYITNIKDQLANIDKNDA